MDKSNVPALYQIFFHCFHFFFFFFFFLQMHLFTDAPHLSLTYTLGLSTCVAQHNAQSMIIIMKDFFFLTLLYCTESRTGGMYLH